MGYANHKDKCRANACCGLDLENIMVSDRSQVKGLIFYDSIYMQYAE